MAPLPRGGGGQALRAGQSHSLLIIGGPDPENQRGLPGILNHRLSTEPADRSARAKPISLGQNNARPQRPRADRLSARRRDRSEADHNVRMDAADLIWNRAALSDGGEPPAAADAALTTVLAVEWWAIR